MTAGWPRSVRRAHWSRMSAMSGETTTVRSSPGERRQLVAEALAAARRHDDERVAPVERGLHGVALAGAKRVEAEQAEQRLRRDLVEAARALASGAGRGRRRRGRREQRRRDRAGIVRAL